jgi:hypothetical protein
VLPFISLEAVGTSSNRFASVAAELAGNRNRRFSWKGPRKPKEVVTFSSHKANSVTSAFGWNIPGSGSPISGSNCRARRAINPTGSPSGVPWYGDAYLTVPIGMEC